jgi:transposase-like protein
MKDDNNHHPIESSREIAALIASYRESGLGFKRFAREHRIPPGRLHYWLYQKHRAPEAKSSPKSPRVVPAPVFQEVKLDTGSSLIQSWAVEVSLSRGLNIRFSATATPGWIGAVVQALQRPC